MAAPVPPGASRPSGNAPPLNYNYNPNLPRNYPDSLADNMQNLQLNSLPPSVIPNSRPGPPPFPSAAPLSSPYPGVSPPISRPLASPALASMPRAAPLTGPPPAAIAPNAIPPVTQPPPFTSRPASTHFLAGPTSLQSGPVVPPLGDRPGAFSSSSPLVGPSVPSSSGSGPVSNGPPVFGSGAPTGGPRFPLAGGTQQTPGVGPSPPTMLSARAPSHPPTMRSFLGTPVSTAPPGSMGQPAPPFAGSVQGVPPQSGSPYGSRMWQMQQQQMVPPVPGSAQSPRMFGMTPPLPNQSMASIQPAMDQSGAPMTGPSKIDPNQIPRPVPTSSVILYETRQGNQANLPPPATSDYIVKDTGNCSPRYMRCTINQIPCTSDLLTTSGMQLALLVQPLALPHPSEEPIQVVDFGESGPVRCSRCKGYMNPFMKFTDQGRRFVCNLCG